MNNIALQISPEAKSAYFHDYLDVAKRELNQVFGDIPFTHIKQGALEFFTLEADEHDVRKMLRLSFVLGVYAIEGELFRPLDINADFHLHDDFVFGSKFRGKTNERLTQMLINVGLAAIGKDSGDNLKLLDPMCGRATTLLWAMRYGFTAKGIEQDVKALEDIQRNLKKWTKIHRQKHKLSDGFIGKSNKQGLGKFLDFAAEDTSMRVAIGDARLADELYKKDKFDLIISDLPYGVQHFTTDNTRNPLEVIKQCITPWKNMLKKDGVIVLAFNSYIPKRDELIAAFAEYDMQTLEFSAAHRMSESIVRDVVVIRKTS